MTDDAPTGPDGEGTAALLVRVWFGPGPHGPLRGRLLGVPGDAPPATFATVCGDAHLVSEVLRWVEAQRAARRGGAS